MICTRYIITRLSLAAHDSKFSELASLRCAGFKIGQKPETRRSLLTFSCSGVWESLRSLVPARSWLPARSLLPALSLLVFRSLLPARSLLDRSLLGTLLTPEGPPARVPEVLTVARRTNGSGGATAFPAFLLAVMSLRPDIGSSISFPLPFVFPPLPPAAPCRAVRVAVARLAIALEQQQNLLKNKKK